MQTETKLFVLVKLKLKFFSGEPRLPIIPKVGPSFNIKKVIFVIARMR